jgi:hypothetical protein
MDIMRSVAVVAWQRLPRPSTAANTTRRQRWVSELKFRYKYICVEDKKGEGSGRPIIILCKMTTQNDIHFKYHRSFFRLRRTSMTLLYIEFATLKRSKLKADVPTGWEVCLASGARCVRMRDALRT